MPIMDQVVEDTRFRSIERHWFERGVREADGSIKPGAQAPGSNAKNVGRAREAGGSAFARFAGSKRLFIYRSWGLRPRLYAAVRFADSASKRLTAPKPQYEATA